MKIKRTLLLIAVFCLTLVTASADTALLYTSLSTSSAIVNTTTETAFSQSFTVLGSTLDGGNILRIHASGRINSGTAASVTVRIRIGGNVIAESIFWPIDDDSTAHWFLNCDGIMRTSGSLGSMCRGPAVGFVTPRLAGEGNANVFAGSIPAYIFALNANNDQAVEVTAQWNEAHTFCSIVMDTLTVELLG